LDELFEALTLVQTKKVTRFPVVLMGSAYWSGLLEWIRGTMLIDGKVGPADLDLIFVTDEPDEAVRHILEADAGLSQAREAKAAAQAAAASAAADRAAEAS